MRINYNVSAMLSNNALANNDKLLSQSLQRLSSGLKINRAKDNPAGLAMAKRMNAQLEGLAVANQNASDGISIMVPFAALMASSLRRCSISLTSLMAPSAVSMMEIPSLAF